MSSPLRATVFLCLAVFFINIAAPVDAAPVAVGDEINVLNGPGTTGGGEFTIVVDEETSFIAFCRMLAPGRQISEVPEPATLVMFGSGVTVASIMRRRSRRQRRG